MPSDFNNSPKQITFRHKVGADLELVPTKTYKAINKTDTNIRPL